MRYLLDTHILLWIAEDSPRLLEPVRRVLLDDASDKYVSIVSAWEVSLKLGKGTLKIPGGLKTFFSVIDDNGFFTLPVEREYIAGSLRLPPHHKDPFDRMIVATAIAENMTLLTADEQMRKYSVSCFS